MRAYLPILHSDLEVFIRTGSFEAAAVFAPTESYISENSECDEEEIEYLLSISAGEAALALCASASSPGLVLALDLDEPQCGESHEAILKLNSPVLWSQVQCALLAYSNEDELQWFATQEISQELENWI